MAGKDAAGTDALPNGNILGGCQKRSLEMEGLIILVWIACAGIGYGVGKQKNAGRQGAALGLLLGPIGVLVASAVDCRPCCPVCGTRLNLHPFLCPQCETRFQWAEVDSLRGSGDSSKPYRPAWARATGEGGETKLAKYFPPFAGIAAGLANEANLLPCPDCGNYVSRLAKACPKCGRPIAI